MRAQTPIRIDFSQLHSSALAGQIALCRAVRTVRRHPRSAAHVHDFFELSFVKSGHYALMQPGRAAVSLGAGEMFLLPPGQLHYERYTRDVRPRVGWIGFALPAGSPLAAALTEQAGLPLRQPVPPEDLESLAAEILAEQGGRELGWENKLAAALVRLLIVILRAAKAPASALAPVTDATERTASDQASSETRRVPPQAADLVQAGAHYLEAHCAEPLSIRAVAASLGTSHAHFSNVFHRHLGVTPRRFLIAARLNCARRLLAEGRLTHAAIAQDCGFFDEAHFSRAFRAFTGVPPSRYQRTPDDIRAAL